MTSREGHPSAARRAAMAILARATREELDAPLARHWPEVAVTCLKGPESGLVMLRGRIGGDGSPFNLGEAAVTRAVIEIVDGPRGYAFVLGRDKHKAQAAAVLDALWQLPDARAIVEREVLEPVALRLDSARHKARAETAATRVDFFTLVRGEPT
jgi:alpha-D-ribose 1-methylphosphonate 5-triphosphate synthase subunit PhnG